MKNKKKQFVLVLFLLFLLIATGCLKNANLKTIEKNELKKGNNFFLEKTDRKKQLRILEENIRQLCEEKYQNELAAVKKQPNLHAKSAVLMDGDTKRVLMAKDAEKQMPMASTTKIMTCYYVLENSNLMDVVTISENAARQPKVRMGIKAGEQYKMLDLLYALMLESFNDVAVAIAEHVSGSVDEFCKALTEKAKELGCFQTNFETPNGLDSENHYTTARELALITWYALKNEQFCKIIQTPSYEVTELKSGNIKSCHNKDAFLKSYDGALGVKTGFTSKAGYCFVGAAKRNGRLLISVVLGCGWPPNKTWKWKDTIDLMNYGYENFALQQVDVKHIKIPEYPLNGAKEKTVPVKIKRKIELFLSGEDNVSFDVRLFDEMVLPASKNECVGVVRILVNSESIFEIKICTSKKCCKRTFQWCAAKLTKLFLLS